ncbi:MAG: hypothetical protein ACTHLO_18610 [Pseudolabrys sp.]
MASLSETGPVDPCERCGQLSMNYAAALPKGPNHPRHEDVFVCASCGNIQWIADEAREPE